MVHDGRILIMPKLNLASGKRPMTGYINIDAVPGDDVDLVANVLDLRQFADGTIEEIYSEHLIEHFDRNEISQFFRECNRLLQINGRLKLVAPSLEKAVLKVANGMADLDWLDHFMYANHTHLYDYHKQGIFEAKLRRLASENGLTVERIYLQDRRHSPDEIVMEATKTMDLKNSMQE